MEACPKSPLAKIHSFVEVKRGGNKLRHSDKDRIPPASFSNITEFISKRCDDYSESEPHPKKHGYHEQAFQPLALRTLVQIDKKALTL